MSKTTQVDYEGKMVPADELDFDTEKEPWSIYKLEDGTVLKAKQSLVNIYRLIDNFKADGEPIYVFKMAGITSVDVPSDLKKKAN